MLPKSTRPTFRPLLKALFVIGALLAFSASAASAAAPTNKEDAKAMGDPAGTAPAQPAPTSFLYNGKRIKPEAAASKKLSCLVSDPTTGMEATCFDSEAEFESAGAADARKSAQVQGLGASLSSSKKRTARAAACGQIHLIWAGWYGPSYSGTVNGVTGLRYWAGLGDLGNHLSSYTTGESAAHLADYYNGGGGWYPGNTSYCSGNSIPAHYPSWDNRVSGVYRY